MVVILDQDSRRIFTLEKGLQLWSRKVDADVRKVILENSNFKIFFLTSSGDFVKFTQQQTERKH